jgi:hypothetical protein
VWLLLLLLACELAGRSRKTSAGQWRGSIKGRANGEAQLTKELNGRVELMVDGGLVRRTAPFHLSVPPSPAPHSHSRLD